jgi:hypothetical protein
MAWLVLAVLWWTIPAITNLMVVVFFYEPYSWEFRDWRITCIAGSCADGTTRIWGQPDGQTWSIVQCYASEFDRETKSLNVHETNHTAWSLCLGVGFLLLYGLSFLWNLSAYRNVPRQPDEPWWFLPYRENWFERRARLVEREYEMGIRPRAWGSG